MLPTLATTESAGEAAGDVASPEGAPPVPDYTHLVGSVSTWRYELHAGSAAQDQDVLRAVQAFTVHVAVLDAGYELHKLVA